MTDRERPAPPAARALRRRVASAPLLLSCLFVAAITCPRALAQDAPGPSGVTAEGTEPHDAPKPAAADSPRAALQSYLDLGRAGLWEEAARGLDLDHQRADDGPRLARHLKAVLDRHAWFDLDKVSPLPMGDATDGLPPATDEIARVPGPTGTAEAVVLVRASTPGGARWRFSASTVDRIEPWYAALDDRWFLENLPAGLLRPGPRNLLWWQWLVMPLLGALALLGGAAMGRLCRAVLSRAAARTRAPWDDTLVGRLYGPINLAWTAGIVQVVMPWLHLYAPGEAFVTATVHVAVYAALFWALLRGIDIGAHHVARTPWALENPSSRSLVPLSARAGKVAVIAIAVVAILSLVGYPVTSLIAGLGIGGLAVALAAQKSFENLFGAFAIGLDQPFRQGDFVKIDDFVGTVEAIGLRSTKVRTLDRTLVAIPNGQLAEKRLESFAARDRIRLSLNVGLVYETPVASMRLILAQLEAALREHPKIWPDAVVVKIAGFGDSSLDIEVMAWFQTADWSEFQAIRQDVLLQFMEVVERAGSSFAFPTRTVHLTQTGGALEGRGPVAGRPESA